VQSKQLVAFDVGSLAPFEIGARLDALLCYPNWSPQRRQTVSDAICAEVVGYTIELEPFRTRGLRTRYPQYTKSRSRSALNSLPHRREKALTFGLAFLPLLKKAATQELPIFNGQQRELSRVEIARFLWPRWNGGADFDYDQWLHDRMSDWRNYHPIAHLAAAYQYIARERSGPNEAASIDYQDLDLHREVVRRANEFAGHFRATPGLNGIADQLIELGWRD
jgi:hypothetical protein